MAVFGIPRLHEDDALRAARAAIDAREALEELNRQLEAERGIGVATRTGINTGDVVTSADPAAGDTLVTGDHYSDRDEARFALAEALAAQGRNDEAAIALGEARELARHKEDAPTTAQADDWLERGGAATAAQTAP